MILMPPHSWRYRYCHNQEESKPRRIHSYKEPSFQRLFPANPNSIEPSVLVGNLLTPKQAWRTRPDFIIFTPQSPKHRICISQDPAIQLYILRILSGTFVPSTTTN